MIVLPIPTTPEYLDRSFPLWSPFLPDIAKRSKETVAELLAQVARIEVQPILVWDEIQGKAMALVGVRYVKQGGALIAELVWLTGQGMKQWVHLLPELERYLTEHAKVNVIRPICRPGWMRRAKLKERGYRMTHVMMERAIP